MFRSENIGKNVVCVTAQDTLTYPNLCVGFESV